MKREYSCPFGSKCEEIKGDTLFTCRWYTTLKGKDPQSDDIIDKQGCAMEWLPILLIENSANNILTAQAVYNLRDETIGRQDAAMRMLNGVPNAKLIDS
jgi:hypothetical protein